MRVRVSATMSGSGVLLRLTEVQSQLICETLRFHADRPDGDLPSIVRIGVDRSSAVRLLEKVGASNAEFQFNEVHVLFAALISATVWMPSEEVFYERIGFFRENALALAGGLMSAIESLPDAL